MKPASPPSTSAQLGLDVRFEAQYNGMVNEMDERLDLFYSSLLGQITSLFVSFLFLSSDPSLDYASAFPGQAGEKYGARAPSATGKNPLEGQ